MTQDTDKPKTLSIRKPLSLAKEAEIFKTFGKEVIVEKSFYCPKQTISPFKSKTQKQISNELELDDVKHKTKKQTSDCLSIEKDQDTNKDEAKKQLSPQEEKAARYEIEKQRRKRRQEALTWLKETFPDCFNLDHPQPLKTSIFNDILHILNKRDLKNLTNSPTRMSLRKAIKYYTENDLYHRAILTSPYRYDLKGNMAQEITDQERAYAKARLEFLETRHKKWRESKKLLT